MTYSIQPPNSSPRPETASPPQDPPPKGKAGAPKGNQNALKHGFYSRSYKLRERRGLENTPPISLAEEIELMRVSIRRLCESFNPELGFHAHSTFLRTLSMAFISLNRLVRTQHQITGPEDDTELRQAIDRALNDLTTDLGLDDRFPSA